MRDEETTQSLRGRVENRPLDASAYRQSPGEDCASPALRWARNSRSRGPPCPPTTDVQRAEAGTVLCGIAAAAPGPPPGHVPHREPSRGRRGNSAPPPAALEAAGQRGSRAPKLGVEAMRRVARERQVPAPTHRGAASCARRSARRRATSPPSCARRRAAAGPAPSDRWPSGSRRSPRAAAALRVGIGRRAAALRGVGAADARRGPQRRRAGLAARRVRRRRRRRRRHSGGRRVAGSGGGAQGHRRCAMVYPRPAAQPAATAAAAAAVVVAAAARLRRRAWPSRADFARLSHRYYAHQRPGEIQCCRRTTSTSDGSSPPPPPPSARSSCCDGDACRRRRATASSAARARL